MDKLSLHELVGYRVRRAQIAMFEDFRRELAGLELTPGQIGALSLIDHQPGMTQSSLALALGIERSTVVPLLDRLEKRGLVTRDKHPTDRRSHALQLSAAGNALLAEAAVLVRRHDARMTEALSTAERAQLMELLDRIGRN